MVFVAFVVGHRQLTPETVEHFQGSPVLRIFFSSLGGEKFPEGNAHSFQYEPKPLKNELKYSCVLLINLAKNVI